MLNNIFQQVFSEKQFKTKSDLHKILDKFYHKRFLIEEMTSYDTDHITSQNVRKASDQATCVYSYTV